ncbi:hypothetical protein K488DRAFT_28219, partial [Vararia minispora EC-137]
CATPLSGRNLVLCIDGTANKFGEMNSNVVELYSRLEKSPKKQITYYDSGIGTYVKNSHGIRSWFSYDAWKESILHGIDTAIAWNFKAKVLAAYQWLSENYENGDRIFLFGFSRGAYQVRVIAGMLELVGLLHKGNNGQIPFAYDLYRHSLSSERSGSGGPALSGAKAAKLCKNFKKSLSRENVRVHFVGAWDTVSSIGILRGRSLPEMTNGMTHVCAFRHALALDELRVKFLPEYANGGLGPDKLTTHVKEVWFVGSHSDMYSGNAENMENTRFTPSLRWMIYEALAWGLRVKEPESGGAPFAPSPSMVGFWRVLEFIPIILPRLSYASKDGVEH